MQKICGKYWESPCLAEIDILLNEIIFKVCSCTSFIYTNSKKLPESSQNEIMKHASDIACDALIASFHYVLCSAMSRLPVTTVGVS